MSESLASIRLRGYNAARDGKPRHCAMANHRHRAMWYDGYDCYKEPDQPTTSSPDKIREELAKLRELLT